jgi:hypothetical protein
MSAALMVGNEDEEERNIHEVDPKVEVQFESAKKRKMSQWSPDNPTLGQIKKCRQLHSHS